MSGMIGLFNKCSTISSKSGLLVPKIPSWGYFYPSRVVGFLNSGGITRVDFGSSVMGFQSKFYYSKKATSRSSPKSKVETKPSMKDRDEFYVVRKGNLVGVYKSLSECQAQVGTSISDPPVSVYKGCNMPKDTENYLISCGLKNALYSISAADLTEGLFGALEQCPVQTSCTLEFDGASKGNPGQAGAGVVLRSDDGSFILRRREGLGVATHDVAEYRALILGSKSAIGRGFTSIRIRGDSQLVCMQIQGQCKVRSQKIANLFEEATKLKDKFVSFQITHIPENGN